MSLRVLVYEPTSDRGEIRELPGELTASLESMQAIVGGNIEPLWIGTSRSVVAVLNENGLHLGLPPNRCGKQLGWVGTFFISRVAGEDFVSLTDEDVELARELFDLEL